MLLGTPPYQLFAYPGGVAHQAAAPCLVMLHGAQHDHRVWLPLMQQPALQARPLVALDLPGHGRSPAPLQTSIEAIAQQVAQALTGLNTTSLLLIGHSMGSLIALELAAQLPNVSGIALLGTAAPMQVSYALLQSARSDPNAALQSINRWSFSKAVVDAAAQTADPDHSRATALMQANLTLMQDIAANNGAAVLTTDFEACKAYAGALDAARVLRCPTLFLLAENDRMTPPRTAQPLIDAVSSAKEIVLLPQTGHSMMAESPLAIAATLDQFAAQLSRSGGA